MKQYKMDGCYFRIKREGKWESICFSDLTHDERELVTASKSRKWLKRLLNHLGDCLYSVGENGDE